MKPPDPSRALVEKAAQDEFVVDQIIDLPQSPDEVIGFHLQQAAEKLLKALLCSLGVHYRRTHNLGELMHLLGKSGISLPRELDSLRDLTPYATDWRYDLIPGEGESALDRQGARSMVSSLRKLVEGKVTGT